MDSIPTRKTHSLLKSNKGFQEIMRRVPKSIDEDRNSITRGLISRVYFRYGGNLTEGFLAMLLTATKKELQEICEMSDREIEILIMWKPFLASTSIFFISSLKTSTGSLIPKRYLRKYSLSNLQKIYDSLNLSFIHEKVSNNKLIESLALEIFEKEYGKDTYRKAVEYIDDNEMDFSINVKDVADLFKISEVEEIPVEWVISAKLIDNSLTEEL